MKDFLIVTEPFGRFSRGDAIMDGAGFEAARAEHPDKVVRVRGLDGPPSAAPAVAPEDTAKPE